LGRLLAGKGKLDEAVEEFRKATEIDPKFVLAHLNLGIALHAKGEADEALTEFRKILEIDPQDYKARMNVAVILSEQGKSTEAIAVLREVLSRFPKDPKAHNVLAWTLATNPDADGRYTNAREAVALASRACELEPGNVSYLNTRGIALYRAGRWEDASNTLQEAIKRGTQYPANWLFLAMTYWQLEDRAKAREWHDKALAWLETHKANQTLSGFFAEAERLLTSDEVPADDANVDGAIVEDAPVEGSPVDDDPDA
jgi:Flp pilus assembly protein TadD